MTAKICFEKSILIKIKFQLFRGHKKLKLSRIAWRTQGEAYCLQFKSMFKCCSQATKVFYVIHSSPASQLSGHLPFELLPWWRVSCGLASRLLLHSPVNLSQVCQLSGVTQVSLLRRRRRHSRTVFFKFISPRCLLLSSCECRRGHGRSVSVIVTSTWASVASYWQS